MISDVNVVTIVGRLTRDPELNYISSGQALCKFSIASNKVINKEKSHTNFFNITVWGKMAEVCGEYLTKGKQILIVGELKHDTWEDKTDGTKKSNVSIVARTIQFLGSKGDSKEYVKNSDKPSIRESGGTPIDDQLSPEQEALAGEMGVETPV